MIICGLLPGFVAQSAETYTVTDLGTLGGTNSSAYGINASGVVVGEAEKSTGEVHATRFSGTGSGNADLGTLGGTSSRALAINASGQVVGWANPAGDATSRATLFGGNGSGNLDLGSFSEANSVATAINASGQIVGYDYSAGGNPLHAVKFSGTGTGNADLGTLGGPQASYAYAINDSGLVVGQARLPSNAGVAALFSGTGTGNTNLGTLDQYPASGVFGINASGRIVGYSYPTTNGTGIGFYAVLFSGTGTGNTSLGTLGGTHSMANAINASDQIVGWSYLKGGGTTRHGFLYTAAEGMIDLNSLADPSSGWVISDAKAINDSGQIAAVGLNAGKAIHALLLSPGPWKIKAAAPTLAVKGKKKITTARAKVTIKGSASGEVTSVTYLAGKKAKTAKGTLKWKFKAKLKPGKNKIVVIAHGPGGDSPLVKVNVTRD